MTRGVVFLLYTYKESICWKLDWNNCYFQIEKSQIESERNIKVFVIEQTPKPKKRFTQTIRDTLHINKKDFEVNPIDDDNVKNKISGNNLCEQEI